MAKKGKSKRGNLLGPILILVGIVLAIGAFLCSFAPAYDSAFSIHDVFPNFIIDAKATMSIPLINFIFGGWKATLNYSIADAINDTMEFNAKDGLSYCALISFILLVLGVIVGLISLFIKGKILPAISGLFILAGGILIFLIGVGGSDVILTIGEHDLGSLEFKDAIESFNFTMSAGTILYGILGILGGIVTLGGTFLKKK